MEAITVFVPRILAREMIHGLVRVTDFTQMVVDVVFVRIQLAAGLNGVLNQRLNGCSEPHEVQTQHPNA